MSSSRSHASMISSFVASLRRFLPCTAPNRFTRHESAMNLPSSLFSSALFLQLGITRGLKAERDAVDAVPQPGRWWAILENVAEMTSTSVAVDLGARHPEAAVGRGADSALERSKKAGPSGSALEFPLSLEEHLPTSGTSERSRSMLSEERTRPGRLRPVASQHRILLWRQRAAPFLICFLYRELIGHGQG